MYIINKIPHGKCLVRYLRTRCFCIRNLTRSLRSLVRFLLRQQFVRKYRTPALSMKYSLSIIWAYRQNFSYTDYKLRCTIHPLTNYPPTHLFAKSIKIVCKRLNEIDVLFLTLHLLKLLNLTTLYNFFGIT